MPPMAILNAPTKMMKGQGYGAGYIYDHDTPEGFSGQEYFPEKIGRREFYRPVERGFEREIAKRLDYFGQAAGSKKQEDGSRVGAALSAAQRLAHLAAVEPAERASRTRMIEDRP